MHIAPLICAAILSALFSLLRAFHHAPPSSTHLLLPPSVTNTLLHLWARILREVERIPALRRLSDSALRVTSATASDGRLAALALYRLGALARAAETAVQTSSVSAPHSVTGADGLASVEGAPGEEEREKRGHEGVATGETGGGVASVPVQPTAAASGQAASAEGPVSLASPEAAVAVVAGNEEEGMVGDGSDAVGTNGESGLVVSPSSCLPPTPEKEELGSPQDESMADEGDATKGADAVVAEVLRGAREEEAASKEAGQEGLNAPGEQKGQGDQGVSAVPATADVAAVPAFDLDEVKRDQRFEQLVEIVECVASSLSVSDVSKASACVLLASCPCALTVTRHV